MVGNERGGRSHRGLYYIYLVTYFGFLLRYGGELLKNFELKSVGI
jgi:hypothetical protein